MLCNRLLHILVYFLFVAAHLLGAPAISAPGLSQPARPAGILPVDDAFHLSVSAGEKGAIVLSWAIAPGHYLYRERIIAKDHDRRLPLETERGEVKDDPTFGPIEVYHVEARAVIPAGAPPAAGTFELTYQGCHEDVLCYPPVTKVIDAKAAAGRAIDAGDAIEEGSATPAATSIATPPESAAANKPISLDGGVLSMLIGFFGLGLLLSLTPCTFPMIPILSGMLANSAGQLSLARSFTLSATYVVAMALAYSVLGVAVAWSGANLQIALQTPPAIVLVSAVFVALALSMFGLYELQLPRGLTTRLIGRAAGRGSVAGAATMGFGSAFIVSPCVTPPLAAALLYVMQSGNLLRGAAALFVFGFGTGVPLLIFGTLGAKALPRSGAWLVRTKHVFGFVFVGLAIWMLGRFVPPWLVAMGWGALFVALGIYATRQSRLAASPRPPQIIARVAGVACLAYGTLIAVSAGKGSYEPLRPLAVVGIFVDATSAAAEQSDFQVVSTDTTFNDAVAAAKAEGRNILVDFSADWCTECKIMERTVFSQERVRHELRRMALIRVDVTQPGEFSSGIMKRLSIVGPPTIVFLNPQGVEQPDARITGSVDSTTLLQKVADALGSQEVGK